MEKRVDPVQRETVVYRCLPLSTVVRWHRAGFKLYWTWLWRHRARMGRKCVSRELREMIFRMVSEQNMGCATRTHRAIYSEIGVMYGFADNTSKIRIRDRRPIWGHCARGSV